jgi:hypothetical protein
MPKTTFFLFIVLLLTLTAFITLRYAFSNNSTLPPLINNQGTQGEKTAQNYLYITPNILTVPPNTPASLNITLDSQGTPPTLIQLELAFDPTVLTDIDIAPGNYFINPKILLKTIDYNNGRISYAIESASYVSPQVNQATVSVVTFTAIGPKKETNLYFLPKTVVKTKGEANSLKAAYTAKIILIPKGLPR